MLGNVIWCICPVSSSILQRTVPTFVAVVRPVYPSIGIHVGRGVSMKSAKSFVIDAYCTCCSRGVRTYVAVVRPVYPSIGIHVGRGVSMKSAKSFVIDLLPPL